MDPRSPDALARIRRAAPRICAAAGRPLPTRLLLDGLPPDECGSDPASAEPAHGIESLAAGWIAGHPDRRAAGLYRTPPGVARALLERASEGAPRPESVLDPAVGAGVFLLEARDLFGAGTALHGADIDPAAVALTRLALWLAGEDAEALTERIVLADALALDWRACRPAGFDLVCGNPPFGNAIERRTARGTEELARLRARFGDRLAGPFDRSVPFVLLGAEALSPSGRYAWLLPRALLSARYGARLRGWLEEAAPLQRLVQLDESGVIPGVGIPMAGWIGSRRADNEVIVTDIAGEQRRAVQRARLRAASWGALVDPLEGLAERGRGRGRAALPRIGDLFEVRASMTVAEAYQVAAELHDGDGAPGGWRLLTAGSLRRYGDGWGKKETRVLGRSLLRPVVSLESAAVSAERRRQFDAPKVIVAGLARILKARIDREGVYAGSVGTLSVFARDGGDRGRAHLIAAAILLNSAWLTEVHRLRSGPAALAGGGMTLLKRDLEELPFLDEAGLERLADAEVGGGIVGEVSGDAGGEIDGEVGREVDGGPQDEALQRTILDCAGFGSGDAEKLIGAWRAMLSGRR